MNSADDFAWFRLFSLPGFGAVRINRLYLRAKENGYSVAQIFELEKARFSQVFAPHADEIYQRIHADDGGETITQYQRLLANDIRIIHSEHEFYPHRFRKLFLDQAPPLLFAWGQLPLINAKGAAIVGSRDASETALYLSEQTAEALAAAGFNVISGYARGVDTSAHFGALKAGGVTTIVLSYGMEHFVVRSILSDFDLPRNSLVLSQFHPRDTWKNHYGMIRNRVIVGLSRAVIVVAAEESSGTANTGQIALNAGIPLLVMSPRLFSPPPQGNAALLEAGGMEITSPEQIIKLLEKTVSVRDSDINVSSVNQGKLPL